MENLVVKHRIEDDNRTRDKTPLEVEGKAHIAEASKHKLKKQNFKKKTVNHGSKNDASKCTRGNCWVCGKSGYTTTICKHKKGKSSNNQVNVVENDDLVAIISEVNMALDTKGYWIDTGATRHICKDKSLFITYEKQDDNNKLYMGNVSTASIKGKGKILLK